MALVFDFDGTITQEDTIFELAQSAIRHKGPKTAQDLSASWDQVVQAYMEDRAGFKAIHPFQKYKRRTVDEELTFMEDLKSTELASLARVHRAGIFKNIRPIDLHQLGVEARESNRIKIREGFKEIHSLAMNHRWNVSIVSVNWSSAFIRGVLHDYEFSEVVANEVYDDGHIYGPRQPPIPPLTTASDKLRALEALAPASTSCCYFGDSTTDLACLLRGSGIVICSQDQPSELLRTLNRLDKGCPHVSESHNLRMDQPIPRLFWARDFREVIHSGYLEKVMDDDRR